MTEFNHPTAFSSWGAEEVSAIGRVIASGRFTMGPEVEAFEQEFADYHGMKHGIMVNSGSSANLIAVAALVNRGDLKRGMQVAVPAIAWSTTYAPLVQYGMDLLLLDVDDTWNAHIAGITDVDAVVGCSILGNPADLDLLSDYATNCNLLFFEDNCESLGAVTPGGRHCGTTGLLNTFSFFYSHQISAIEGGMILTNDDGLALRCQILRAHGWTRDVAKPRSFEEEYNFVAFGYNVRPLEMHAAIAREQLRKLSTFIAARRTNQELFWALAEGLPLKRPKINGFQSPFGIAFSVEGPEVRNHLVKTLRENGIDCRLPTGGSLRKHGYGIHWRGQHTPKADWIHNTGMFLGNPPWDAPELIDNAVKVIKSAFEAKA